MNEDTKFHPRAVIFDMDGLILDTERPLLRIWKETGKLYGYDISDEFIICVNGMNDEIIHSLCIKEYGSDFPFESFWKECKEYAFCAYDVYRDYFFRCFQRTNMRDFYGYIT